MTASPTPREMAERLRRTTEQMANFASVDMALWNEHSNACLDASDALLASQERVRELEERLECNHAFRADLDGILQRVEVEPGSIPDGIECRDETIRLQKRHIDELRTALADFESSRERKPG